MKASRDTNKPLIWRLAIIIIYLFWIISFLVRIFVLGRQVQELSPITLPMYIGFCVLSGIMFVILMIFPYQFYIHALFCLLWGLVRLIDGGGLSALLVHLMGYVFLYRQGFFKTNRWIKLVSGGILLAASIASQMRYGQTLLLQHLLQFLDFALIACIAAVIFWPEIHQIQKKQNEMILRLSKNLFSKEDVAILQKVLSGEKYETIANEAGQSLSTVKKRMHGLFLKLQVNDRITFMSRYSNYRIELVNHDQMD